MIGQTISHYEITAKIGRGGMGVVYKARDLRLERFVAMKFLPRSIDGQEEEKQRFIIEAKAASSLDHPNICTIHEIDETTDGQLFIVMGYYDGETLKEKIDRGPMRTSEALDICRQVSQGLSKAAKEGIVHRDIKPANIIVTTDGVAKILDFGLARLSGQTKISVPGARLGTAAYMSPEQIMGEELDHRSDVWSFGVVLYEMVSGRRPFQGNQDVAVIYAVVNEEPEPPSSISTAIRPELERIILTALAKDRKNRYQHINELLADVERIQEEAAADVTQALPPQLKVERSKRKTPLYAALGVASATIIAAGIYFATNFGASDATSSIADAQLVPESATPTGAPESIVAVPSGTPTAGGAPGVPDQPAGASLAAAAARAPEKSPPVQRPVVRPAEIAAVERARPEMRAGNFGGAAPLNSTLETPLPSGAQAQSSAATNARNQFPAQQPTEGASSGLQPRTLIAPPQPPPPDRRVTELAHWMRIRQSSDLAVFQEFLQKYPAGSLRQDAVQRVADLKWEAARETGTAVALNQYLQEYPNGRDSAQARTLLLQLEAPPQPPPAPLPVQPSPTPLAAVPNEEDAIRQTLGQLTQAYQQKDIDLVTSVWPTLDSQQVRRLESTFQVARSMGYELQPLASPQIAGDRASVRCARTVHYVDERGPQRPVQSEVTVQLRKRDESWVIESMK